MDRDEICTRFLDALEFELYPFQEEALLSWFESEGGLLVTVPTGMGKTLIAEAAIFEALQARQRLYYTTPLIALTDQKFREFQDLAERWGFARGDIGLITGNRRVNPDAPVRVVVAEILLNHLLAGESWLGDVSAVVMDEFHYFNDWDRGVVWELSLVLLPAHIRLMLLSATVGNPAEFVGWVRKELDRQLKLVQSDQRRVPLEYIWVGDKLLTEHLPAMLSANDADQRAPALVFCFNRDECWEVAERIKGVKLIDQATRTRIEEHIDPDDFAQGAGPKLRQMLIRGVGVHHAGILPKYKEIVEALFLEKLIPFVICTETLAAGINLPARSVVISTLLKGKRGDKKLVAPSSAHQMFGRAGRPQFDTKGYVFALAHDDDVKIHKWRMRYEQIDPNSKDPGLMRARKDLERKKPSRRKTEQYWSEGQFRTLIQAGPARLASRAMIPYQVLIYLLTRSGSLEAVRRFLSKRFNRPEKLEKFQAQLDHMIANLETFGYLTRSEDDDTVTLSDGIQGLLEFRSIDPLYAAFLVKQLVRSSFEEKILALESALSLPPAIEFKTRPPDLEPGPLQTELLEPRLLQMGLVTAIPEGGVQAVYESPGEDYWARDNDEPKPLMLPELLKILFDAKLASPEPVFLQPKWVAGGIRELEGDFFKFVRARDLIKNEGLILRHLLRLVILAGEFLAQSDEDPDYARLGEEATRVCQKIDARYTDRFLASDQEARQLSQL
jgi:superfamily II DNA/RNA helicase